MKVDLRIERLILDGVELTRQERAALGPAIERELGRLLDHGRERPGRPDRSGGRGAALGRPDRSGGRGDALVPQRLDRIGRDVAAVVDGVLPKRGGG